MTKIVTLPDGSKVIELRPIFDNTIVVRRRYVEVPIVKNKPKVQEDYIEPEEEIKEAKVIKRRLK